MNATKMRMIITEEELGPAKVTAKRQHAAVPEQ